MSVLGIISEYNPFHNGHLYHLEQSKKLTGCSYSVCVMSGNFIQRGEPALIDKWARTKMALKSGIDLVLELPVIYSLQTAELFAFGGIKILDSLGIVDYISFGSETGSITPLEQIASILVDENDDFKSSLKYYLSKGLSFPQAREKAIINVLKDENLRNILGSSNNILGIEYLKSLIKLQSSIKPFTIKRIDNQYTSTQINGEISSATSIRSKLFENENLQSIRHTIPKTTYEILSESFSDNKGPIYSKDFEQIILSIIRKMSVYEIENIFDVTEGLEYKFKSAALKASSIEELIFLIKSKRYTQTKIQRILYQILLGISKQDFKLFSENSGPQYIRILGFNQNGKKLLNSAKKKSALPTITKVASFNNTDNPVLNKMLQFDITATDIYTLAYKNPKHRKGDWDYKNSVVIE